MAWFSTTWSGVREEDAQGTITHSGAGSRKLARDEHLPDRARPRYARYGSGKDRHEDYSPGASAPSSMPCPTTQCKAPRARVHCRLRPFRQARFPRPFPAFFPWCAHGEEILHPRIVSLPSPGQGCCCVSRRGHRGVLRSPSRTPLRSRRSTTRAHRDEDQLELVAGPCGSGYAARRSIASRKIMPGFTPRAPYPFAPAAVEIDHSSARCRACPEGPQTRPTFATLKNPVAGGSSVKLRPRQLMFRSTSSALEATTTCGATCASRRPGRDEGLVGICGRLSCSLVEPRAASAPYAIRPRGEAAQSERRSSEPARWHLRRPRETGYGSRRAIR